MQLAASRWSAARKQAEREVFQERGKVLFSPFSGSVGGLFFWEDSRAWVDYSSPPSSDSWIEPTNFSFKPQFLAGIGP